MPAIFYGLPAVLYARKLHEEDANEGMYDVWGTKCG